MKKINICIIGARSYSCGSLLKLLAQHERVKINMLVSESKEEDIQKIHPCLRGVVEGRTEKYEFVKEKVVENNDLVFLHKKGDGNFHEETTDLINLSKKLNPSVRFIDLSGDFRLKDGKLYKPWYGFEHSEAGKVWLEKAVYGLTELYREKITDATLVANPGCYPTAALLALAPLLRGGFVDSDRPIFIDAVSGVSGAGALPNGSNLAIHIEGNIKPYKVGRAHQHVPEMEQEISIMLKKKVQVTFVPYLLQFKYGILSTHYLTLKKSYKWEDINSVYKEMYQDEPFIRLMPENTFPEVANVEGTNFCDIGFVTDKDSGAFVIMSAIDNMIKGASGQAVQNMNVMYGFEETEGLPYSKALRMKSPYCSIPLARIGNN